MNASIAPIAQDGSKPEQYVAGWNDCFAALRSAASDAEPHAASMYGAPNIVPGTVNIDPHGVHAYGSVLLPAPERPCVPAPTDVEQMLHDCVPGGSICDPQAVADSIREWFDRKQSTPNRAGWALVPTAPTEAMLDAVVAVWQQRLSRKAAEGALFAGGDARQSFTENYAAMLAAAPPAPREAAHPDDAGVDRFAAALKAKLAEARAKGRDGWYHDEPDMQQRLSDMLREHVDKGDPRDVANFCMFLHQRGEAILPASEAAQEQLSGADRAALVERFRVASRALVKERKVFAEDVETLCDVLRMLLDARPEKPAPVAWMVRDCETGEVYFDEECVFSDELSAVRCAENLEQDGGTWESIPVYTCPAPLQRESDIVVTRDERGFIVAVTRQDDEHRILKVIATNPEHVVDDGKPPQPVTDEDVDAALSAAELSALSKHALIRAALETDRKRLAGERAE